MSKSTVLPFHVPSEFSPDPLTELIQAGAKALLRTAVQAEVSAFIAEYAHLLDEEGRQRLVRHGFLPEREMMTGIRMVPVQVGFVATKVPKVPQSSGYCPETPRVLPCSLPPLKSTMCIAANFRENL